MVGLQLRTDFDRYSMCTIIELKKLCNAFGIIPVCSDTGSLNDMKFHFGEDVRRQKRFGEGIARIFNVKHDPTIRRQVFGKKISCPWKRRVHYD